MLQRRTLLSATGASAVLPAASTPVRLLDWHDRGRDRTIPVLIRVPAGGGPAPLVLLSHGLGGSRHGLAYLGRALADAGYIAVHLQHKGSDTSVWDGQADPRSGMAAALLDAGAALARLHDAAFALDRLLGGGPLDEGERGLAIDRSRVAIAGHSYGAWTASHMVGERLPVRAPGVRLPDPRLQAAVMLSPIPPLGVAPDRAYADIAVPTLHVTGTRDNGFGAADWRARTIGFRQARAETALAVMAGAAHSAFAGEEALGGHWNDPTYQERTASVVRTFLDAVLRRSAPARAELLAGAGLRGGDVLETRLWTEPA